MSRGIFDIALTGQRQPTIEAQYAEQPQPYRPRYRFDEPQSGQFDPEAPRFVYRQDVGSFTRKTQRVPSDQDLQLNQPSQP